MLGQVRRDLDIVRWWHRWSRDRVLLAGPRGGVGVDSRPQGWSSVLLLDRRTAI